MKKLLPVDLYQYVFRRIKANPTCPIRISTSWPNVDSDQASSPFIAALLVDDAIKEENGLSIEVRKGGNQRQEHTIWGIRAFIPSYLPSF